MLKPDDALVMRMYDACSADSGDLARGRRSTKAYRLAIVVYSFATLHRLTDLPVDVTSSYDGAACQSVMRQ